MDLKSFIRPIPDFPYPGVMYRDITPLLSDHQAFSYTIEALHQACKAQSLLPDFIVGIEARGFIFGAPLAYLFNAGFVPVRKAGKLPGLVYEEDYLTEYSKDRIAVHSDVIKNVGAKVLIVDDLIALGGTAKATITLMEKLQCEVIGFACLIELNALQGRCQLPKDLPIISLLQY
jgi:adenine phosphoribosyltransferase